MTVMPHYKEKTLISLGISFALSWCNQREGYQDEFSNPSFERFSVPSTPFIAHHPEAGAGPFGSAHWTRFP
jgi:hypothetical protein